MTDAPKGTGERFIALLRALAEMQPPYRVSDLSRRLGLSPSTVHRMLGVLRENRLLEEGEGRNYRIGVELYRLASLFTGKYDLADLARPFLQKVVAASGEVSFFCKYHDRDHAITPIIAEHGGQRLQYRIDLLVPLPAAWGASGIAVVAFLDPAERRRVWEKMEPTSPTGTPKPDTGAYEATMAGIREKGFVWTRSEKMPGAVGFASPVFGSRNELVGSLCATVPEHRFDTSMISGIATAVRAAAAEMSATLGGVFPMAPQSD